MKDLLFLFFDLLTTLVKLLRPGGSRAVIAENLLLKQQLIIHNRSRQRAPNLTAQDRALLGFWTLFLNPRRELLDQTLFRTATVLDNKLLHYQDYYNEHRCHSSRDGKTPVESGGHKVADISSYPWEKHCRGLFHPPAAA